MGPVNTSEIPAALGTASRGTCEVFVKKGKGGTSPGLACFTGLLVYGFLRLGRETGPSAALKQRGPGGERQLPPFQARGSCAASQSLAPPPALSWKRSREKAESRITQSSKGCGGGRAGGPVLPAPSQASANEDTPPSRSTLSSEGNPREATGFGNAGMCVCVHA